MEVHSDCKLFIAIIVAPVTRNFGKNDESITWKREEKDNKYCFTLSLYQNKKIPYLSIVTCTS